MEPNPFATSSKVTRSPKSTRSSRKPVKSSCQLCTAADNENMVMCDDCDKWFHFSCVGVTDDVAMRDWSCADCRARCLNQVEVNATNVTTTGASVITLADKVLAAVPNAVASTAPLSRPKSSSSKVSSARRLQIELERLEEERVLQEKRDKEEQRQKEKRQEEERALQEKRRQLDQQYLDRKYSLLQQQADDELSSVDGDVADVEDGQNNAVVQTWLEDACNSTQKHSTACGHNPSNAVLTHINTQLAQQRSQTQIPNTDKFRLMKTVPEKLSQQMQQMALQQQPQTQRQQPTELHARRHSQLESIRMPPTRSSKVTMQTLPEPLPTVQAHSQHQRQQHLQMSSPPPVQTIPPSCSNLFQQQFFEQPMERNSTFTQHRQLNTTPPTRPDQTFNTSPQFHTSTSLSKSQLAARHTISRDLQPFSGNPGEWPTFICDYERTSELCGFSDEENISRLQRALKGEALEAVRSMLLQPSCVKRIISTLKMLYGRPELVIHSMLHQIHSTPSPKEGRLEGIVKFSLAVQNLCATIEASGLMSHLCNPALLQELIEKLPPTIRLVWGIHRQSLDYCTLSDFNEWLYQIACAANCVTIPTLSSANTSARQSRDRGYLHAHTEEFQQETTHLEDGKNRNQPSSNNGIRKNTQSHDTSRTKGNKCCVCSRNCPSVANCHVFLGLSHSSRWAAVKEYRLCHKCLKPHLNRGCRSQTCCGINGCGLKHHKLLHNPSKPSPPTKPESQISEVVHYHNQGSSPSVLYRYVPVVLHGKNAAVHTYAFLDDGSSLTLMDQEVADELNIDSVPHPLCLKWTANTHRYEDNSKQLDVNISGIGHQAKKYCLHNVRTVESLGLPKQSLVMAEMIKLYPHLKSIPATSYEAIRPRILIGLDNMRLGFATKSIEGPDHQPFASKTRLGWVVYGPHGERSTVAADNCVAHHSIHMCECNSRADNDLQRMVKDFFALESLGTTQPQKLLVSRDEQRAQDLLHLTTKRKQNRFETGLLWRFDDIKLPDSREMAMRRLVCIEKRMMRDPRLRAILDAKISYYLTNGYIRKLSTDEARRRSPRTWYLPVFPVINTNKPGKVRLVWDAAAQSHGVSLNSFLLKGPDQLTSLTSVLARFRKRKVAIWRGYT